MKKRESKSIATRSQESPAQRFTGQVVIVTGGGSGIGRATARAFAAEGARVLVVGRRLDSLAETAQGFPSIATHAADLRRTEEAEKIVEAAVDRWSRLDVLVNNAAILGHTPLRSVTIDKINEVLATNLIGPTFLCRAALPHLEKTKGRIVNVSSIYGRRPAPDRASYYGASKAALEALTRSWAVELGRSGIRVNAVAPGPTESEALSRSDLDAKTIAAILEQEANRTPLGRRGQPEEIAEWILHLATRDSWVTGQVLDVDGGFTLPTYDPARD